MKTKIALVLAVLVLSALQIWMMSGLSLAASIFFTTVLVICTGMAPYFCLPLGRGACMLCNAFLGLAIGFNFSVMTTCSLLSPLIIPTVIGLLMGLLVHKVYG